MTIEFMRTSSILNKIILLSLLLFIKASIGISSHQQRVPVELKTNLGSIRGVESIFLHKRVRSFLSVPFAEPPIGENRFKPPQRLSRWSHTIDGTQLSSACYQGRDTFNGTAAFWGIAMWNANTEVKEDCLYMNIWTPADATNLTVMVWLFGGGFYSGSPSLHLYDGNALALLANAVIININYRVGPFGYLYFDHEDVPGNVGMLDQQIAFQWIKENIESFGGNPSKIALFGESAGAASIVAHMIAPDSYGLFSNGILQSGSLDNKWSIDTPERAFQKSYLLAKRMNCEREELSDTITCLREVPPDKLIAEMWSDLEFLEFPFVIVTKDRNFFKNKNALTALREGSFNKNVNIMVGINHDEGNFWNIFNLGDYFNRKEQPLLSRKDFLECVQIAFDARAPMVKYAASFVYDQFCTYGDEKVQFYADQVNQMVGDYFFTCDSIWLADQVAESGGNVYIYYFDQPSSANPWPKWTGVMHAYEIEYVFGVPIYNMSAGYKLAERIFSEMIVEYWKNFATHGQPYLESKRFAEWPEYGKTKKWMYLRAESKSKPIERRKVKECEMWRNAKDLEYLEYIRKENRSSVSSIYSMPSILILIAVILEIFQQFA